MKKGIYRHYKGGLYDVLDIVIHTETSEEMVLYEDVKRKRYVRPLSMWNEKVNGKSRFEYVINQLQSRRNFRLG